MTAAPRRSCVGLAAAGLIAAAFATPAPADERLDAQVLRRVKDSSVLLRVLLADRGAAEGSGFFAIQPGLVVTNAHVVGMNVPGSKKPLLVNVVVRSGESGERTVTGTVLDVDPRADLAVVRVEPKELPPPLPIVGASELQETQSVYVFGFPFGSALGKNISVRRATVSSLRREGGALDRVQVEGGIDQGNSGGPVVDATGRVVGVSVSKVRATQINFAIPGEKVTALIRGKADKPFLGIPFRDGDVIKLPVRVPLVDPLNKIKKVALESWTAKDDTPRAGSATRPEPRPGDSPRVAVELAVKDGVAVGEVRLPTPNPGETTWVQPRVEFATGDLAWDDARRVTGQPPVERKPVALKFAPPAKGQGRVKVDLKAPNGMTVRSSEELGRLSLELSATANETSLAGRTRWTLTAGSFVKKLDDRPSVQMARENLPAAMDVVQGRDGAVQRARLQPEPAGGAKNDQTSFAEHVQLTLALATPPLPDKEMEPGKTWTAKVPLAINLVPAINDAASAEMTFTYEGVRPGPGGREEALVTSTGLVTSAAGKPAASLNGIYVLDRETGRVTRGFARVDFELESIFNNRPVNLTGEVTVDLRRGFATATDDEKK